MPRIRFLVALGLLLGAATSFADDAVMMTCPSASAVAIGTATKRLELGFKNEHANDICFSTRSNMTCDGTVGTDGFHCDTGACFWFTETSFGAPASQVWYCRAATSDATASRLELFRP